MGLLHPTRDIPRKQSGLKAQSYVATVVVNDDTQHKDGKKRQRVQFRLPQLHRGYPDEHLPWAMPQHGQGSANAGAGVGFVGIPPKNAKVMITFDEEDPHIAYYSSSPTTDDTMDKHEALKQDYPHTIMNVDHAGNKTSVNTKKQTITDTAKSGATIHRDKEGNIYLYAPKDLILGAKGDVKIAAKGKAYVHAKGDTSIKGGKISLNGSEKTLEPTVVGERETPQIPDRSANKEQ